jgi:hypothetical protein
MLHEKMFLNLQQSHRIVIGLCWQAAETSLAGVADEGGGWIRRVWGLRAQDQAVQRRAGKARPHGETIRRCFDEP